MENNIHYFNDNYMHGLKKTNEGDRYDTGAYFLLQASKFKSENIKISDYIIHYNNASWMDTTLKRHSLTIDKWLKVNKKLWSDEKNKKVIYTCITSGYDALKEPSVIDDGFDYVCFTDNASLTSNIWDIRPLPKETEGLSQVKKQRFVKINPHLYFKDYDISIWIDGNVDLRGGLNELLDKIIKDDCSVYVPQHPARNCIYDEASIVIRMRKDTADNVKPQIERYKEEGFPSKYGLLQSNILIRKHNNEDCIKLMESWFDEVKNGSHRDQLSFNYASWKNNDVNVTYLDKNICKSRYFFWSGIHRKAQTSSAARPNYFNKFEVQTLDGAVTVKKNRTESPKEVFHEGRKQLPQHQRGDMLTYLHRNTMTIRHL